MLEQGRRHILPNGQVGKQRALLEHDAPAPLDGLPFASRGALDVLADTLAARVAPGGRIALSGILKEQEDELLARYAPWFDALSATGDGDWMRIDGIRR